ncbi:hypothetical protein [Taylorella asinigenitalis]|nr:hypothetical protein [Taylorella asinigenitalis]
MASYLMKLTIEVISIADAKDEIGIKIRQNLIITSSANSPL